MSDFVTRQLPSRKLLEPTAIPWAEPAAPVAVPYPSYETKPLPRRESLNRRLLNVELNVYPETVVDGYYPGSTIAESNRISFKRKHLVLKTLDEYPETPVDQPDPSSYLAREVHRRFGRRQLLDVPELNERPQTDPGFLSGYYPGSALAKSFKRDDSRRKPLTVELNEYPQLVLSDAVLPAFYTIENILTKRTVYKAKSSRGAELLTVAPVVTGVWTIQADSSTTWSTQTDDSATWTKQTDSSDTWTPQ